MLCFAVLQAAEAVHKLSGFSIDCVVSSPFKRCLQTSAGVVRGLPGLTEGQWLVDWQLAEVRDSNRRRRIHVNVVLVTTVMSFQSVGVCLIFSQCSSPASV